ANENAKQVQKNAFILLDNLIYEYVTRQWRGSSDGIIARNILNFDMNGVLLKSIESNKWKSLITEIIEQNNILGESVSKSMLEPILYHYYAMKELQAPDSNFTLEVDHIIPQSLFKA